MKVLFLGTSAGWPLPRLGCQCPICTSPDPKDKRLRPSILINKSVLIDAGPDFYHQIKKFLSEPRNHTGCGVAPAAHTRCEGIGERNIKTILISHIHPDHFFGLWDVAKIYGNKPAVFLSTKNKKLLLKRINDTTIIMLLKEAKTFESDQEIKLDKNLSITPFLVDHSTNTETFGFFVKERAKGHSGSGRLKTLREWPNGLSRNGGIGKRSSNLIYIPDFRTIPQNSLKYCRNANLAILDGSNFQPAGPARWGHMPIKESIKLAKKLKIKKVYFIHIGHGPKMGTHQELQQKVQKAGGQNFHIAYDGLKL